tara:strand:- start:3935 stop:4111 length:177 start_codon:yes stop_codon:yes gene_type:complete
LNKIFTQEFAAGETAAKILTVGKKLSIVAIRAELRLAGKEEKPECRSKYNHYKKELKN